MIMSIYIYIYIYITRFDIRVFFILLFYLNHTHDNGIQYYIK